MMIVTLNILNEFTFLPLNFQLQNKLIQNNRIISTPYIIHSQNTWLLMAQQDAKSVRNVRVYIVCGSVALYCI